MIVCEIENKCWKDDRDSIIDGFSHTKIDLGYPDEKEIPNEIKRRYQKWYSSSSSIIERNYNSERNQEFKSIYESTIKNIINRSHMSKKGAYILKDSIVYQSSIIDSLPEYMENQVYNVEMILTADLMDSEIEEAKHLLDNGFVRAAGAITGVVLERYLKTECDNAEPSIRYSKRDSLSDLNNLLKKNKIFEKEKWRKIQYFSDIRNKCGHDKEKNPTNEEVKEFIDGVKKIIHLID